jgi:peptidoglycan DL-endopeptidase CwlO
MAATAAFFPARKLGVRRHGREQMLAYAETLLDVPYEINLEGFPRVPGGRGFGKKYPHLDKGLDCSGYVLNVLNHMGFLTELDADFTDCDRIFSHCNEIGAAETLPGDLIFFEGTFEQAGLTHIGIVTEAGGGAMISARQPGVGHDSIAGFWKTHFAAYGRPKTFLA